MMRLFASFASFAAPILVAALPRYALYAPAVGDAKKERDI